MILLHVLGVANGWGVCVEWIVSKNIHGYLVWFDHKWKKFSGAIETQNGGSMDTPS